MLLERRSRKDGKTNVGTFSKDTIHYFGAPGVKFGRLIGDFGYRYVFYFEDVPGGGIAKLIFTLPRSIFQGNAGLKSPHQLRLARGSISAIPMESRSTWMLSWGTTSTFTKGAPSARKTVEKEGRSHDRRLCLSRH